MGKVRLGVYKHFKGKEYEVLGEGFHSETKEEYVVYRALYGDNLWYIRPKTMFLEKVVCHNNLVERFKFMSEKSK